MKWNYHHVEKKPEISYLEFPKIKMTRRKSLKTINLLENTPMWTGCNTERFTEKCPRQRVECMQHIPFLPTRTNVVKETIIQSKRVSEECGSTFDLAIAKIAKEIQNEEPD